MPVSAEVRERMDAAAETLLDREAYAVPRRWEKPIRKTVYTLNLGHTYEPVVCALTYPLMRHFATKIGAEFRIITERRFPEWPAVYEKLQIHELGRDGTEWNIYFDSDALISPEMFDPTDHLSKDTVMFNGKDMAGVRWTYDQYFRRDGRHLGACNWFAVASDWCLDLWRPLDDLTPEEAFSRIHITTNEHNSGMFRDNHLIDDYTLSRNIARFGLKHKTLDALCGELGWQMPKIAFPNNVPVAWGQQAASPFLFHLYALPTEEKIRRMLDVMTGPLDKGGWGLMNPAQCEEFKKRWGVK